MPLMRTRAEIEEAVLIFEHLTVRSADPLADDLPILRDGPTVAILMRATLLWVLRDGDDAAMVEDLLQSLKRPV